MHKFKVGDVVITNEGTEFYTFTKPGNVGVVSYLGYSKVTVKFFAPLGPPEADSTWTVDAAYLDLLTPLDIS